MLAATRGDDVSKTINNFGLVSACNRVGWAQRGGDATESLHGGAAMAVTASAAAAAPASRGIAACAVGVAGAMGRHPAAFEKSKRYS